jgi:hypothetical protein
MNIASFFQSPYMLRRENRTPRRTATGSITKSVTEPHSLACHAVESGCLHNPIAALTGGGGPVNWQVDEVGDAPSGTRVLAQLSNDRTNKRYPQLVREDFTATDVDMSVRFKTISGEVDASGGLVFRYRDKGNFYVVRANSLEGNVVAYRTENGTRTNIGVRGKGDAYGVKADVPHRQWNELRVLVKGKLIEVFLNDRKLFDVEDDTFQTAGRVGLWTKADAVTQFDDLTVTSLD